MISAIGVSYLLQNLATYITGGLAHALSRHPVPDRTVMQVGTSERQTVVTIITPILTILLVVVLGHSYQAHQDRHGHARGVQGL